MCGGGSGTRPSTTREATTRYVKILDQEDPKAADVISAILGDVA
jgi:hypothetical protein